MSQGKQAKEDIILSVNAYSFNDLLSAKSERNNLQVYNLFKLLDWCASQKIRALDPTAYYFTTYPEVPSDEYLDKFKNYAENFGVAISETGIKSILHLKMHKLEWQG